MARPRSEEARRKVLGAASDLMAARGVASLTIDEVAARSGVAKTTIYRHWQERTSLIIDAVEVVEVVGRMNRSRSARYVAVSFHVVPNAQSVVRNSVAPG